MYIFGNGRVITQDKNNPYLEDGAVVVQDDKIIDVGEFKDLSRKYSDAEFINAKGRVIMPGLINTHMHIYSSFARGMKIIAPTRNFDEILENLWWKVDKNLTLEGTKYSAYATYIDCIKNGVTTVIDHHASPYHLRGSLMTIGQVAEEIGIRASLSYEVSDRDGEEIAREGIEENIEFIKWANEKNSDMISGMFGMHAAFTLSDETLKKCQEAMEPYDNGYHIHVAEGYTDLENSLKVHGKRVVERLNDFGIFREKTIAVHCIHVNSHELDIIEKSKCNVVHNPESNMGNAVGCSPALHMIKRGIKVGLGSDGYTSDMLESYKVTNVLHKHHLCDPTVAWGETPQMLFDNNREIVKKQFNCESGILKIGGKADIIIMDYLPHTEMNGDNLYSHILFGMAGRGTVTTMVNGKLVMRDRVILTIDEEAVLAKAREVSKEMWKSF
ncbi:putative selenium metabolism protein SsnA [Cetobacterium ceti]|uniref:Putative selenium metabolism protein SsnA n=1 Tax=Cetobacterium ceti TaxID=180163 RepID=A0A1T4LYQ2_9FUSO|nr:putative aminohydrolase SsnA [Cetobacterium ceti]SJZ59863.1 putative selenium metabolism protein SsnA [Cetobacterium ceti]